MSEVLAWEQPPPTARERWALIRAELAARPDEWAKIAEGCTANRAENITANLRKRGLKASIRKVNGSGWSVWAMCPQGIA